MIKTFKLLLVAYSILLSIQSYSQIKKEIYTNLGASHLAILSLDPIIQDFMFPFDYNYAPSLTLGGSLYKPIFNDVFIVKAGLEFNTNAIVIRNKEGSEIEGFFKKYEGKKVRFYNISIPMQIGYAFEEYLHFNIGLSNNFHLINNNKMTIEGRSFKTIDKMRLYSLGYIAGFDFTIKEKYSIGFNYQRDITASVKDPINDFYHYFDQINLRIGYQFK
ncbi:MAG TPA: hypothetical protein EYG92_03225 [Lutibacter sp.]|nr:hypothetical protein [Lutibacter sp.]